MSLEFISGLFAIISGVISVLTAVVKINRAIVALEEAVKRLDSFAKSQQKTNEYCSARLLECERRLNELRKGGELQ